MTQVYYGTKKVTGFAQDMESKPGYGIIYEDGYQSWSPKKVFEDAYQPLDALSWGHAMEAMLAGHAVTRNWNNPGVTVQIQFTDEHSKMQHPYFYLDPGNGKLIPWTPSNLDLFANDWQVIDPQ